MKGIKNREISRLNRSRIYGMVRLMFNLLAIIYKKQGIISNTEDINYLTIDEIKEEDKQNGYYIPIKDVMDIVTKLENHTLVRPNIGGVFISSSNIDALNQNFIEIPNISGVVVADVAPDYPLSIAGFIKGDVITKIDDVTITDVIDMQKEIYSHNAGDTITIEYYRYGILNTASVVLNK